MNWQTIITAAVTSFIVTLLGSLVTYFLTKKTFEHQTQYAKLHEKRAEVIAELYNRLYQAEFDATLLTHPKQFVGTPTQVDRYKTSYGSGKSLDEYFERNRIYFIQSLCEKISDFSYELHEALVEFQPVAKNTKLGQPKLDAWIRVWGKISKDIPSLKSDIENEFRGILGISPDKAV